MERKVSRRMYEAAQEVWEACLRHPFVQGMGDGSLPVEKFQYFMLQDYLYLFEYARVFALGVVKARNKERMRMFAQNVEEILDGEMNIHRTYMERLGIGEEAVAKVRPALANTAYTGYMLSVAQKGTEKEIVASVLACSWSYAVIGTYLAQFPGAADHPFYGEWIRGYAGEDYQRVNENLIELMDSLAAGAGEEEIEYYIEIFVNCSRFELAFWDMAWRMDE